MSRRTVFRYVDSKDTNINGEVLKENEGRFDIGMEFGTQGIATDDVQHMEFTLSADAPLSIGDFDFTTIGFRATSVGDVDGSREGSLKLVGEEEEPPNGPNSVDAVDDSSLISSFELAFGNTVTLPVSGDPTTALDVRTNDVDIEGDAFAVTGLTGFDGSTATFDASGWSGWVTATSSTGLNAGLEVSVNNMTGEVRVREDADPATALRDLAVVQYEITDDQGATDVASIEIGVLGGTPD